MACSGCLGGAAAGMGRLIAAGTSVMYVVVSRDNIDEIRVFDESGNPKQFITSTLANAAAPVGCVAKAIMV